MPNDAKFGLVVGVALVIAVAVLFFRKDTPPDRAATIVRPTPAATPAPPPAGSPSVLGETTARTSGASIPPAR